MDIMEMSPQTMLIAIWPKLYYFKTRHLKMLDNFIRLEYSLLWNDPKIMHTLFCMYHDANGHTKLTWTNEHKNELFLEKFILSYQSFSFAPLFWNPVGKRSYKIASSHRRHFWKMKKSKSLDPKKFTSLRYLFKKSLCPLEISSKKVFTPFFLLKNLFANFSK